MADSKSSASGIGFSSLLTIVFIVLKLTKVISWSWVWVLAPTWISIIGAVLIVLVLVLAFIAAMAER